MKIFLVGSGNNYAIENFYTSYLREAGVEVYHFPALKLFLDYYHKNLLNKLVFRSGLSPVHKQINHLFKKAVDDFQPDVVWVFKGMQIFASSLQWVKNKNFKLINYNPDSPFIFAGSGSGNKNVTDSVALFDLHFTYSLTIKKQIEEKYRIQTSFLPFGFDISNQLYETCCQQTEILKACFLGNPDEHRAAFINDLAAQGIELDVYGTNWKKFLSHSNITIYPPVVYGDELWKTLRRYRVQLNLMRIHNLDSHNMRSFEVPGIGGIMLAPDTKEHRMFFENEKEIFLYSDISTCAEQIKKIISLSSQNAFQIRENARNRSVNSGYDYRNRTLYALSEIKSLLGSEIAHNNKVQVG
jgi:spore maturation protein CgeB